LQLAVGSVFMIYIGGLIILVTIFAIIKKIEVRLVLFLAGIAMALLSGDIRAGIDAFTGAMTGGLVPIIATVMGFAYVLKLTKCDQHLVRLVTTPLTKARAILIPGTVIITMLINTALTSAAGVGAAVGSILIPVLMAAGVKPAVAGAAVLAGTFGSAMNPGHTHIVDVTRIANEAGYNVAPMDMVATIMPGVIISTLIGAAALTVLAYVLKENKGYVVEDAVDLEETSDTPFKVNILKALVPLVPLIILVIDSNFNLFWEYVANADGVDVWTNIPITVPQVMLLGTALAALVSLTNPQEIAKSFFSGMGSAYAEIIGIIVAASVFTAGMQAIGITGTLVDVMEGSEGVAGIASVVGPFLLAILAGSGDAATLAFNGAITPYAANFGMTIPQLGTTASLAGALGRTMSPVAGVAIVCASIAKVNPMELAKRNAPGMILAAIVLIIMVGL